MTECGCGSSFDGDTIQVVDAAPERALWKGPIGIEGTATGDGRTILPNALRWDTLPIPLRWAEADFGEHDGAAVVGKITAIERNDEGQIIGSGEFDLGSERGREAYRHVKEGLTPGISMDLDDVVLRDDDETPDSFIISEGRVRAATMVAIPAFEGARIAVTDPETFAQTDTFNWVEDAGGLPQYSKRISKHLTRKGMSQSHAIATAVNVVKKMCATGDLNYPGAQQVNVGSRAEACAAVAEWEAKKAKAKGETLVASAAVFDFEWFENPRLTGPTPLTVTDEGRVFGHLATWGTCHIANPQGKNVCTQPPRSASNYAYFKTGAVSTTRGDLAVGKITMSTLHAKARLSSTDALQHYENTGNVGAYVNIGEDAHGIWVAGSLRPGADHTMLKGAPISGDWRPIGKSLELVAALSVNVPGFPIPRAEALVAGGAVQSLVAAGLVTDAWASRAARRRRARLLSARVSRLASQEKVRRLSRSFAYNPDQWRVPKGNGSISGRWIDMPNIGLGKLGDLLADAADGGLIDDTQAERLGAKLDSALDKAEQSAKAIRANDGDSAKRFAGEASDDLSALETDLMDLADSGSLGDDKAAEIGDALESARESVDLVKDSDLSLLGDKGIGGDAPESDIGSGDNAVVGDLPEDGFGDDPVPLGDILESMGIDSSDLATDGTILADDPWPLLNALPEGFVVEADVDDDSTVEFTKQDGAWVVTKTPDEEAIPLGMSSNEDPDLVTAGGDAELRVRQAPSATENPNAADAADRDNYWEGFKKGLSPEVEAEARKEFDRVLDNGGSIDDALKAARDATRADINAQDAAERDNYWEGFKKGLSPEQEAAARKEFDRVLDNGGSIDDALKAARETKDTATAEAVPAPNPKKDKYFGDNLPYTKKVEYKDEAGKLRDGYLYEVDGETYIGGKAPGLTKPSLYKAGEPDKKGVYRNPSPEGVFDSPGALEREIMSRKKADSTPAPESPSPGGSEQQRAARNVGDVASQLEAGLMDAADSGALDEADTEAIGAGLENLRAKIEDLIAAIDDGAYNEQQLTSLQAQLSQFEGVLMSVADKPGLSDSQAAGIGQILDDLFSAVGTLASSLQGSMEPPPFAARRYSRQWLGRRGIQLGKRSLI